MSKLIKTKFINLKRRDDRLKTFKEEMEKHSMYDYERFEAIDGYSIAITDEIKKIFENNTFGWRKGIIGCGLSHFYLWKDLVNSDYKYYLVLEDDVILCEKFQELYIDIKRMITVCDYPFIYLGYSIDPKIKVDIGGPTVHISTLIDKNDMWGGTFAYIIHRNMAQKFIDKVYIDGLNDPIDVFIMNNNGLHETVPKLVKSPIVTFGPSGDDLFQGKADSDIQYDHLDIFDNFVFFPYLDSPGNNMDNLSCDGTNLKRLKEIANGSKECVAFNSIGHFKNKIVSPKEFVTFNSEKDKKGGLYLKIERDKDFDFYPCLDSYGDDIKYVGLADVNVLKALALDHKDCVAFNTYGCLKNKINDPKDFILLPECGNNWYSHGIKHGLYVKRDQI